MPVTDPSKHLHLAVALDGAGWHPAAWRTESARPAELLTPGYWTDLVSAAERATLDFVTIEDSVTLQSDDKFIPDQRTDRVRGRLDAVLIAARVAPRTTNIGFIPTATVTHSEPFHVSKAIATLDYVSSGRAGVRVQIAPRPDAAKLFGRREIPPLSEDSVVELFDEAADYVEVLRRLWDSWEDDAEIRDIATGRFVDRNKLHYIDFKGEWFSVKGPSITPRPPQGQPIVAALAHSADGYRLIARSTDVGFVTPHDAADAADIVDQIAAHQQQTERTDPPVRVFADLTVFLGETQQVAAAAKNRLDELAGSEFTSDAEVFVGTPAQLADLLQDWQSSGLSGYRLRPGVLPDDLTQITEALVPELRRRGLFRTEYPGGSLRGLLDLGRPANRYASA
jgi:alkanesulfonate monooxygenase SsuD/methylene tetrahydromethanopterin reductase-like flavin-dependent oxidoreductase (luciferase family)